MITPQTRVRAEQNPLPTSPLVTAIVPSRGRPLLLQRAIRSITYQDYDGPIECLVVYDGDDAPAPAETLQGQRSLRAIRNTRTPGAAGARNTGALAARGEFLAFCDDDDEWLPEKLQRQVDALAKRDAAVATSGIYVSYRGRLVARVPATTTVTFASLLRSRRADMHTSTFVVRRRHFIETLGLFDESIPGSFGEDYEFLLRAAREAPICAVDEPLARVYWHDSSWFVEQWDLLVEAMTYLIAKYPEFERERRGLARIFGQMAFAHAAARRRRTSLATALRCLRLDPRQPRAYIALLIAAGALSPDAVLAALRARGRGI
jgi:glycosyltransferase involved in cell wall biosynthesis